MPDIDINIDTAVIVPVNFLPLIDDTDFVSIKTAVAYNAPGMDLVWNFVTSVGVTTATSVTPTTGGVYDWIEHIADKGMYSIKIPASGGASINNDTEGYGWFTGVATGVLPWRSPIIEFKSADLNDGSNPVAITVYQTATTTPIPDVSISILNAGKTFTLGTVATDVNGQTKDTNGNNLVMLDPIASGYVLSLRKSGVAFAETVLSQADVVAGVKTVYGTQFIPAIPVLETQSLYGQVVKLDTSNGVDIVSATIAYDKSEVQDVFVQGYKLESTLVGGYFNLIVPWYARIRVTIPRHGTYELTVTPEDYRDLADYVDKGEVN